MIYFTRFRIHGAYALVKDARFVFNAETYTRVTAYTY